MSTKHTPAASGAAPALPPLTYDQIDTVYRKVWSTFPSTTRLIRFAHAIYALASPQVAPAPEPIAHLKACGGLHAWMSYRTCSPDDSNAIPVYEGATPVQVAPQEVEPDVGAMEYRGNTVSFMYNKAKAYGDLVLKIHAELREAGFWSETCRDVPSMLKLAIAAGQVAPQPIGYAVERSAFRVSPHGQDSESREWMEFTDDPKEKGAFPVWAAPVAPQDDQGGQA